MENIKTFTCSEMSQLMKKELIKISHEDSEDSATIKIFFNWFTNEPEKKPRDYYLRSLMALINFDDIIETLKRAIERLSRSFKEKDKLMMINEFFTDLFCQKNLSLA